MDGFNRQGIDEGKKLINYFCINNINKIGYGYPEYRQNNNNNQIRRQYHFKSSITNQISEQEKLEAETALRSLKMKMAKKGKKPIRQTNTANQVRRAPNYNNINMTGNKNINRKQNYNMDYNNNNNIINNMNYNYPKNTSQIGGSQKQYGGMNSNVNRKPITANQYNRNHTYNDGRDVDMNNDNIYSSNIKNRNYNNNQYNLKNNNFNNNYNHLYNNYQNNNNIRKNNNNYNNNYNYNDQNENDERPIGGGLTADQMPEESSPTSPCPHCGRSFNSQAMVKHVRICEKVFLKKRKAFNTQKQRIQDSEQASLMKQGALEEKRNPLLNNKKTGAIPKWKLQSMAFRAICHPGKNPAPNQLINNNAKVMGKSNIKGMGMNNKNMNMGNMGYDMGGISNAMTYGYKHCEFCNRNYNEEAYNKHLNFCKRRYENEKLKNKIKKTNTNNNTKKNYGSSLSGGVKYNNGKYNKKK